MSNDRTAIKFCFEVDPFEIDAYHFQVNYSTQVRLVEMTSNSSLNDVGLFVGSLLAFNNLSFNSEFFNALFKEEALALVGGLLFEQNNQLIGASCCADFQDWSLVVDGIKKKSSPWMGHSPSPWFEFEDENIILWSEDEVIENAYSINFTQHEFDKQLLQAKQELKHFAKKIEVWAAENCYTDCNNFLNGIKHYLLFEKT